MTGHVLALVLGHDRALALYEDPEGGDALADRHAGPDGLLHLPRPVAALGGERMSTAPLVLAHAGHWLVSLAYIAPLIFLVGVILVGKIRDRRAGPGDPPE